MQEGQFLRVPPIGDADMGDVESRYARHECDEVAIPYLLRRQVFLRQISGWGMSHGALLDEPERVRPRGVELQRRVSVRMRRHVGELRVIGLAACEVGRHVGNPSLPLILVNPIG